MPLLSECPRPGCIRTVASRMFACTGDWFSLPVEVRNTISRTWAARLRAPSDEVKRRAHMDAKAEALRYWAEHPTKAQRKAAGDG